MGVDTFELIEFADPFAVALKKGTVVSPTTSESHALKVKITESTVPYVSVVRVTHPEIGFANLELKLDGKSADLDFNKKIEAQECIGEISGQVTITVENLGPEKLTSTFIINCTFSYLNDT